MIVQTPNNTTDVQKHQSNKNQFTNDNFQTQCNDPKFFSFATHNVRSCTLDVKISQIEQFFTNYNLDILGLSETHFNKSQAFYYSRNLKSKPYRFLFSSNNPLQNCQGVGFVIRNYLYDHIFYHEFLFDRIAYIDLQFKNKTKLRIFQIYLPANHSDKSQIVLRKQIETKLTELILDAQNKSFHIVFMGDFNVDIYNTSGQTTKQYKEKRFFIDKLFDRNFILANNLSQTQFSFHPHTYINPMSQKTSHLDYIFTSAALTHDLTSYKILDQTHIIYESDHLPILISIYKDHFFRNSSSAYRKQHKTTRKNYNYDKTANLHWDLFSDKVDKLIKYSAIYRDCDSIDISQTTNTLNKAWDFIANAIITAANKHIPKSTTTIDYKPLYTFDNSKMHRQSKTLYKAFYKCKALIDNSHQRYLHNDTIDSTLHLKVLKISAEHLISSAKLDSLFYQKDTKAYLSELKQSIIKPFESKLKIFSRNESNKRIKEFILQRATNYTDAPAKMIDSCLDRTRKTIVLNRVLIDTNTNDPYLELDPDKVKSATMNHFKNVAGSSNLHLDDLIVTGHSEAWKFWKDEYKPLKSIDDNLYNTILNPPTNNEWLLILKHLPDGKAPGPSNISNEFLKHLGPRANKFLYKIICACFTSGLTPVQWNLAHVFPIPKPKPWNCDLNNTRPITLLETARKAFTKILNNRIQQVLLQSNALSGLNFAGLPHQSTNEPLNIVNNLLEYHRLKKKSDATYDQELYILFQDMSKAYDRVNIFMLKNAMV